MKLTLSISPCPNDTFMFDALINGRIDTEGLELEVRYADIEELNSAVMQDNENAPDISKISYAVVPLITERYAILHSGSALGHGNGPLLVAGDEESVVEDYNMRIAIPGYNTTANLLLTRIYPRLTNKREYLFSDIAKVIAHGECDAGVLIHEGRFVYHSQGLSLLADLGVEWGKKTGLPLPLGAIAVRRTLPAEVQQLVDTLIHRSIEYAFTHPEECMPFVRSHAQEMDDEVMKSHIALFVNEHSLDIGAEGRTAVERLTGLNATDIFRQ